MANKPGMRAVNEPVDKEYPAYPDFIRTSGDMVCEVCGKPYWKHVLHPEWPWLHVCCDGKLLKL